MPQNSYNVLISQGHIIIWGLEGGGWVVVLDVDVIGGDGGGGGTKRDILQILDLQRMASLQNAS